MKLLLSQGKANLTIPQYLSAIKLIWGSPSTVPEWHDWSHSFGTLELRYQGTCLHRKAPVKPSYFMMVASSITLRTVNREPAASGFTCERSINDFISNTM
jgi:hypothetical protein